MTKRVFFSFHYQDVIDFRANVVRNCGFTKGGGEEAGFFDASVWETTKQRGPEALKRLINGGLENTSVTCVLIGSLTYARPWVRYEIFKSMKRGNKIIGVHVNDVPDKDRRTKELGPNPFVYVGISYSFFGETLTMHEWRGSTWIPYEDIDGSASYHISPADTARGGHGYSLSDFYRTYSWNRDGGYENFSNWIL
jgi:hypothetical protein